MATDNQRLRIEVLPGQFSELTLLASLMADQLQTWTLRHRPVDRCTRRELAAVNALRSVAPARRAGSR